MRFIRESYDSIHMCIEFYTHVHRMCIGLYNTEENHEK